MDVTSRYKGSYQLTIKNSKEVAQAFQWIYENTHINLSKDTDNQRWKGILRRHDEVNGKA